MRHSCYKNSFFTRTIAKVIGSKPKSAVVYYGDKHPYELLSLFDVLIVESANIHANTFWFKKNREKIFAYVSIGEVEQNRSYYPMIDKEWIVGENRLWQSKLLNLSDVEYQNFLIHHVIADLIKSGYKNFFFDTVDSYQLLSLNDTMRDNYEEDITLFLKKLKTEYPDIKVILNRGFEIIDKAYSYIDGVLFESLFYGLDNKTLAYGEVSRKDREWLLEKVKKIQSYGLLVIALDYLPSDQQKKAKDVAKQIKSLNIIPYIGDKNLQTIGTSVVAPMKGRSIV